MSTRPVRIGVCSWSLQPAGPGELVERTRAAGLGAVQLALDPLRTGAWDPDETRELLAANDIRVLSGMMSTAGEDYSTLDTIRRTGGVRPDRYWRSNRAAAELDAELAEQLGLELVTLHAGFLPERRDDPERGRLIGRLREIVDVFASRNVTVAFETGQESAATLLDVLEELARPSAGVNFDPANMLLYGMGDPVEALSLLARHVHQVHVKDARRPEVAGEWGTEVPVGTGEVDWARFFEVLQEQAIAVDLLIEREAGDDRIGDIRTAHALVREHSS